MSIFDALEQVLARCDSETYKTLRSAVEQLTLDQIMASYENDHAMHTPA